MYTYDQNWVGFIFCLYLNYGPTKFIRNPLNLWERLWRWPLGKSFMDSHNCLTLCSCSFLSVLWAILLLYWNKMIHVAYYHRNKWTDTKNESSNCTLFRYSAFWEPSKLLSINLPSLAHLQLVYMTNNQNQGRKLFQRLFLLLWSGEQLCLWHLWY